MTRVIRGAQNFAAAYQPLSVAAGRFDRMSNAEIARWAQRAGVPGVSHEAGRSANAEAIESYLRTIYQGAGDAAVARFFQDTGAPTK